MPRRCGPGPDSHQGLALSLALNPAYSAIDAFHMTAVTIDEAVRRLLAVGGSLAHIGGVDSEQRPVPVRVRHVRHAGHAGKEALRAACTCSP